MKINTNLLHNLMLSNIHKSAALALVSRMAYAQTAAFDPNEFFDEAYLERLLAANGGEGLVGDNGDSGLGGGFGGGDSGCCCGHLQLTSARCMLWQHVV